MTQSEILNRAWHETLRRWDQQRKLEEQLEKAGDPAPIATFKKEKYWNELQEIEKLMCAESKK